MPSSPSQKLCKITSMTAADALLVQVVAKPLQHIVVADAILDATPRGEIQAATSAIDARDFKQAMIATRKALYLAIESE